MNIFLTSGTGYMGARLVAELLQRGHCVRALARKGAEQKLPPDCTSIIGNALDKISYMNQICPADTFVHLVGVAHPNPAKAEQFRTVDLVSGRTPYLLLLLPASKILYMSVLHIPPL